ARFNDEQENTATNSLTGKGPNLSWPDSGSHKRRGGQVHPARPHIRPGACKSPFLRAAAALFQFPHPKRATFAFATRSQAHPATAPAGSNRSRLEETKCLKPGYRGPELVTAHGVRTQKRPEL